MKAHENPFRMERLHHLPFLFSVGDLPSLRQRAEQLAYRCAIVGGHGSGKTTLLEELMQEFTRLQIPYAHLRLRDDGRKANAERLAAWFKESPQDSILLLDSAGLLGWWNWREVSRLSRANAGLIITTHRPGRLPTLIHCHTDTRLLQSILKELGVNQQFSEAAVTHLFRRHRGNIRDCLRELYDRQARD